jgi:Fe-S cluster assembly protein SufD
MKTESDKRKWLEDILEQTPVDRNDSRFLKRMRERARSNISEMSIPTRKTENWRYTLLEGLFENSFKPVGEEFDALQHDDIDEWLFESKNAYQVVFANGRYVPALTSFKQLPKGVSIGSLRQALLHQPEILAAWFGQTANHTQDVFTALNTALINDGLFVHLDRNTELDRPLEVIHVNLSLEQAVIIPSFSLIIMEQGSKAEIIERYISTGDSVYFFNEISEILLEERANLDHVYLQDESRQAFHLHKSFLSQGQASRYKSSAISYGSKWARKELHVRFQAKQAECQTNGLYLVGTEQLSDQHLEVLHNRPENNSYHRYKGIVYGEGRAVFDGRVIVQKDAQKTDAQLANHNLLLSRDAEVDTRPQLEIYADDVKCSHGTTVGQLEPEQLFYLQSRGISKQVAMKMLCAGFAGEIVESVDREQVRDHVIHKLDSIIEHVNQRLT